MNKTSPRGFTLIEMLLVLAILSVITVLVVPSYVRSIRGNRLRSSARTVVMAGRYARSMAVLRQEPMTVRFDLDNASVSVEPGGQISLRGEGDALPVDPEGPDVVPPPPEDNAPEKGTRRGASEDGVFRALDRVAIDWVELDKGRRVDSGTVTVTYGSNGRCVPYAVRIRDEDGLGVLIEVDALASATTEME